MSGAYACLLLVLSLQNYLITHYGDSTEHVKISTNGTMTRPETSTPQGTIRGINMLTRKNRTVFGFVGIPYAQPPIGELRFKSPVPAGAWNGTLDASTDTEPCPQLNDQGEIVGIEDCLHLNVFTPQLSASNNSTLLPVMLYVIGGGFKTGNNSLGRFVPEFMLDKDVVLVIPNFRLGALGFLSTGDEVSPGNYGLKDILESLKWVQNNIQYFGGDPNQVTLFGGSSGAFSVHLLALSNLTDGLIHKYITQSGTALSYGASQPRQACKNRAIQLGKFVGCPTNSSTLLVNCLRGLNVSQLVDTFSIFYVWASVPDNVWTPTIEPDIEGALLTDTPANLYAKRKIRDLPWIGSVTRDDGLVVSIPFSEDPDLFEDFLGNIDFILPQMLDYQDIVDDPVAHTSALKSYYLNDLTANRSLLWENFTQLAGDALFVYPTYSALRQHLVLTRAPEYLCSFQFRGTFSHSYLFSGGSTHYTGSAHGDELLYLFGHQGDRLGPSGSEFNEADYAMVETMVELWTSFAASSSPKVVNSHGIMIWEPYSPLDNYLQIGNGPDTTLEMKYNLHMERMQFWDELTKVTTTFE